MAPRDESRTLLSGKQKSDTSERFFREWTVLVIVLAQMSTFVFAWAFAGSMMRKTVALPDTTAVWIQNNPSDVQVVVTLVSTLLALVNSFLLGKAVQYALVHRLSRAPLSLRTMVEWARLAQRSVSLNFDRRGRIWTLLSVVWVGLLGFLTTAWSSLLAPESVTIYYEWPGREPDLLNPFVASVFGDFVNGYQPTQGLNLTTWNPGNYTSLWPDIDLASNLMDAGFFAASANIGIRNYQAANLLSIYGSSYVSNTTTGGIFPTGVPPLFPSSPYSGVGNPLFQGFSRMYNMAQQGFTANVSCRYPTSNDPVITPNVTNSVPINGNNNEWYMNTYSWSTNCSSGIEYSTYGVPVISSQLHPGSNQVLSGSSLFMTSICLNQGFAGASNQSFLVLLDLIPGSSSLPPQICQVMPLVTTVQTTYDENNIINIIQPALDQHPLPDPTTTNDTGLMWFPAFVIWSTFVMSQGLTENIIEKKLNLLAVQANDLSAIIENYLRGMMEYLGSLMTEVAYTANYPDGWVRLNGTLNIRTFGWTFHLRTHGPSLAAITLVTALTVAAGTFTMIPVNHEDGTSRLGKLRAAPAHFFNPTETMDILLASAAGDLARALSEPDGDGVRRHIGFQRDRPEYDERLRVVLEKTEKGRPMLKTVDSGVTVHAVRAADVDHHAFCTSRGRADLGTDEGASSADISNHEGDIELGDLQTKTKE